MKLILAIVVTAIAYLVTFLVTKEIWAAIYAAGLGCLIYTIFATYELVKYFTAKKAKYIALVLATLWIGGISVNWVAVYKQIDFQTQALHYTLKGVTHSAAIVDLYRSSHAIKKEYFGINDASARSIQDILLNEFQFTNPQIGELDYHSLPNFSTNIEDPAPKFYATDLTDSSATLILQSTYVKGEDPLFKNYDGSRGLIQDKLTISINEVEYEFQN